MVIAVGGSQREAVVTHEDTPGEAVCQATDAPAEEDGRIRDRGTRLGFVDDVAAAAAESEGAWTWHAHAHARGRGLLCRSC